MPMAFASPASARGRRAPVWRLRGCKKKIGVSLDSLDRKQRAPVKRFQSGASFLIGFFVRPGAGFFAPTPAVLQSRRAQELPRLAVAPTLRHTLALPGHTLTASSTTARLVRSG
jgi:hypothetical protein